MGFDNDSLFDLSDLIADKPEPAPAKPAMKQSIQFQAAQTKTIARELEIEHDYSVAKILREKLNESFSELARMIVTADAIYAEFDANTKHILIDGNSRGHIFSEREFADKSAANFKANGYEVYIKEYTRANIFDMLFEYKRHGIQDLVLDETEKWVIISTETLSDMLDVSVRDYVKIQVTNPGLMFNMTTLSQKMQFKTDNPKRKDEINSLRKLMIRELTGARYILPLAEDNKPITRPGKDGQTYILIFADEFEMNNELGRNSGVIKDYEILTYKEIIKRYTVMANTIPVLNYGSLSFKFTDQNCDLINRVMNQ